MLMQLVLKTLIMMGGLILISCESGAPAAPPHSISNPAVSPVAVEPPATTPNPPAVTPVTKTPSINIDGVNESYGFGRAVVVEIIPKTTTATIFDCAPISEFGKFKALAPAGRSFRILLYPRSSPEFKLIEAGCPKSSASALARVTKAAHDYGVAHQLQLSSITIDLSKLSEGVAQLVINLAINGSTGKTSEVVLIKDFSLGTIRLTMSNGKLIATATNTLDANGQGVTTQYTVIINHPSIGGQPAFTADPAKISGRFVDGPVGGMGFVCTPSQLSGNTSSNGEYSCDAGDRVAFYVFGKIIGSAVAAGGTATPYSVFEVDTSDNRVRHLARLLMQLNANGRSAANISLPTSKPAGMNLPSGAIDFISENAFQALFPGNDDLPTDSDATDHLNVAFAEVRVSVLDSVTDVHLSGVTDLSGKVNCGKGSTDCKATILKGESITLIANGVNFIGWDRAECPGTSATCTFTVTDDTEAMAKFGDAAKFIDSGDGGNPDGVCIKMDAQTNCIELDTDGDGEPDCFDDTGDEDFFCDDEAVADDVEIISLAEKKLLGDDVPSNVEAAMDASQQVTRETFNIPKGNDPSIGVFSFFNANDNGTPRTQTVNARNFPPLDQGKLNSCAAFALCASLQLLTAGRYFTTSNEALAFYNLFHPDCNYLYYEGLRAQGKLGDCNALTAVSQISKSIVAQSARGGFPTVPNRLQTTSCPITTISNRKTYFSAGSFSQFPENRAKTRYLRYWITSHLNRKRPVIYSAFLPGGFKERKDCSTVFKGSGTCTGTQHCSGHAVTIAEYHPNGGKPVYLVINSWGPDWGCNGKLWWDAADLERNYIDAIALNPPPPRRPGPSVATNQNFSSYQTAPSIVGKPVSGPKNDINQRQFFLTIDMKDKPLNIKTIKVSNSNSPTALSATVTVKETNDYGSIVTGFIDADDDHEEFVFEITGNHFKNQDATEEEAETVTYTFNWNQKIEIIPNVADPTDEEMGEENEEGASAPSD